LVLASCLRSQQHLKPIASGFTTRSAIAAIRTSDQLGRRRVSVRTSPAGGLGLEVKCLNRDEIVVVWLQRPRRRPPSWGSWF